MPTFSNFPTWLPAIFMVLSLVGFLASVVAIQVSKDNQWGQSCPILAAGLCLVYFLLNLDAFYLTISRDYASYTEVRHYAWFATQFGTLGLVFFATRGAFRTSLFLQAMRQIKEDAKPEILKASRRR